MAEGALGGSFRDPSGFVFRRGGVLYRQVNRCYAEDYDALMASGLHRRLVEQQLLVDHEEVAPPEPAAPERHRTLRPELVPFVSYPYEWCFGQLKDAALATLRIQREALQHGMTLKDASAYNIQFHRGRPLLIDTLSFRRHRDGEPWIAYRQFCQHFLAPLALMSRVDVRLGQLLRVHLDGIPLDLAASLLPRRTWLRPGMALHLWLHARLQRRHARASDASPPPSPRPIAKSALLELLRGLERTTARLDWRPEGTVWADYYAGDSYEAAALDRKKELVAEHLAALAPRRVWDLGANTGVMSRIASGRGAHVVAFDVDPACVERSWRDVKERRDENLLPLLLDLVNPSPAIGWANRERASIFERPAPDAILALALVHHLAIANNVPLPQVAATFAQLAEALVIEFVPKGDPKVRQLLASREDVFPDYTREGFEAAFQRDWRLEAADRIAGSERTLYRMRRRGAGRGCAGAG
jgi:ribosomal protein L11 methylase PrmA